MAAHEVVRSGVFMTEVLVDPQKEILRGLVESPSGISRAPGIPGPQDLLDRREDRVLPVTVPKGARRRASNRLLPDRERFEVVDRRPQISRGPLDDHLEDVRSDIDPLLGGNGAKYVFHCVIVNGLKFDGLA